MGNSKLCWVFLLFLLCVEPQLTQVHAATITTPQVVIDQGEEEGTTTRTPAAQLYQNDNTTTTNTTNNSTEEEDSPFEIKTEGLTHAVKTFHKLAHKDPNGFAKYLTPFYTNDEGKLDVRTGLDSLLEPVLKLLPRSGVRFVDKTVFLWVFVALGFVFCIGFLAIQLIVFVFRLLYTTIASLHGHKAEKKGLSIFQEILMLSFLVPFVAYLVFTSGTMAILSHGYGLMMSTGLVMDLRINLDNAGDTIESVGSAVDAAVPIVHQILTMLPTKTTADRIITFMTNQETILKKVQKRVDKLNEWIEKAAETKANFDDLNNQVTSLKPELDLTNTVGDSFDLPTQSLPSTTTTTTTQTTTTTSDSAAIASQLPWTN